MARGGHNKKSPHLHLIQGTLRADHVPDNHPKPTPLADLAPPKELDHIARTTWRALAPKLERLGLLTELDTMAFTALCAGHARWERARRRLQVVARHRTVDLALIRKAEVSIERAEQSLRQLWDAFGMTPTSRSRLDVFVPPVEHEEDNFAREFLHDPKT